MCVDVSSQLEPAAMRWLAKVKEKTKVNASAKVNKLFPSQLHSTMRTMIVYSKKNAQIRPELFQDDKSVALLTNAQEDSTIIKQRLRIVYVHQVLFFFGSSSGLLK